MTLTTMTGTPTLIALSLAGMHALLLVLAVGTLLKIRQQRRRLKRG